MFALALLSLGHNRAGHGVELELGKGDVLHLDMVGPHEHDTAVGSSAEAPAASRHAAGSATAGLAMPRRCTQDRFRAQGGAGEGVACMAPSALGEEESSALHGPRVKLNCVIPTRWRGGGARKE